MIYDYEALDYKRREVEGTILLSSPDVKTDEDAIKEIKKNDFMLRVVRITGRRNYGRSRLQKVLS